MVESLVEALRAAARPLGAGCGGSRRVSAARGPSSVPRRGALRPARADARARRATGPDVAAALLRGRPARRHRGRRRARRRGRRSLRRAHGRAPAARRRRLAADRPRPHRPGPAAVLRRRSLGWLRALAHPVPALALGGRTSRSGTSPRCTRPPSTTRRPRAAARDVRRGGRQRLDAAVRPAADARVVRQPRQARLHHRGAPARRGARQRPALGRPPLYDVYTASDPLADQELAAGIMMVEGSLLTLILFGWLFLEGREGGRGASGPARPGARPRLRPQRAARRPRRLRRPRSGDAPTHRSSWFGPVRGGDPSSVTTIRRGNEPVVVEQGRAVRAQPAGPSSGRAGHPRRA